MKRCPQCEFIYEDDQSLCDMDGVLLVFDSRSLPNHHALATVAVRSSKTQKRKRTVPVPAFATLILVLVLGAVYFVSTQRSAATLEPASTTSITIPESNPAPPIQPAEVSQLPAATETKSTEKVAVKPAAVVAPVKKPAMKTAPATQTRTSTEPKKDESKVGSILKKTGRILKKPFKF